MLIINPCENFLVDSLETLIQQGHFEGARTVLVQVQGTFSRHDEYKARVLAEESMRL